MSVCAFLIAYAFVGCAYWLWTLVGAIRVVRSVPMLAESAPPAPAAWPRLSIIVPACNEAATLEPALKSIQRQDYPDLEIVLIDDRSTDGTAEIVDRMAAGDPRIVALHVQELPDGWLGKVHAMELGVRKANGSWLLFTDADVYYAPGALRRAVGYCTHREIDHLAAIPEMWRSSLLVDACIALFCRAFAVAMRLWGVADAKSAAFAGVGAFNLVRGGALERTRGFQWLRMEVADDMGLGMMLKQSGARCELANARGVLGLHWYRTLREMANGAEKAYASAAQCSLLRTATLGFTLVALEWAPLAALAGWNVRGLRWSGLAMLAAAVGCSVVFACRWKTRLLPGLLFPVAALIAAGIMLRSGWLGFRRGGIAWRGTLYRQEQLLAGRRLKVF